MKSVIRRVIKSVVKSAASFLKQTFGFASFLAHLLWRTRGDLRNPIRRACSGKLAVLANGPSLKDVLPRLATDEFKDTDFIAMNFFGLSDVFSRVKPRHYCLADPMFIQRNHNYGRVMGLFDALNKRVDWEMNLYIPAHWRNRFPAFSGLHNSHIHVVPLNTTEYGGYEIFRRYFYRRGLSMPVVDTVALMAIYVGINSGYGEVDLYGVDHTFFDSLTVNSKNQLCRRETHFYDKDKADLKPVLRNDNSMIYRMSDYLESIMKMFKGHDLMAAYAASQGVRVVNCTECSMIDSYERKNG